MVGLIHEDDSFDAEEHFSEDRRAKRKTLEYL